MRSVISPASLLAASLLAAAPVAAQEQAQEPPRYGTLFKDEIDRGIHRIRATAQGAMLGSNALDTAMLLAAMGNCHRYYSLDDGPVVRLPLRFLFDLRQTDGSFAAEGVDTAELTAWTLSALESLEPREFDQEIRAARSWLRGRGPESLHDGGFAAAVARALESFRERGTSPRELGAAAATALEAGEEGAIPAVVELVALQRLGILLDQGAAESDEVVFTDAQQRGFDFLLTQQQDGRFLVRTPGGAFPDTGLTGMGLAALQTKPMSLRTEAEQQVIDAGLTSLLAEQNEDGSFGQRTVNYATCAAILALSRAENEDYREPLERARDFVLLIQNVEARGYSPSDRDYGSIGYGGDQRGDLSNLQFAVEALRASGLEEGHESLAKALVFLQRTQNLRAVNDFEVRAKTGPDTWERSVPGDDGGSAYYPGNSPAGYAELPDGSKVPRSYGSMTYALLKTYSLCGLPAADARIQAAVRWLEAHWTLDENPGASPALGEKARYQGLFYYYMVMAQALDTVALDSLGAGENAVDWRAELRTRLESVQRPSGSWLNERNGRWWEDTEVICTVYSLLALERCAP